MKTILRPGFIALCVVGCASPASHSPAPIPVNFPSQVQPRMQAVAHWRIQAELTSRAVVAEMSKNPILWPAPLVVHIPARASEFERAMARMLSSDLVAAGMTVAVSNNGGYPLQIEGRLIEFGDRRRARPPLDAGENRAELDAGAVPRGEVLLTVAVASDNRYLFRTTRVLYARDADRHLYIRPLMPQSSASANAPPRLIDLVRKHESRREPFNP